MIRPLSIALVVACALGSATVHAALVIPSPASDILLSSNGGVADINGQTTDGPANYGGLPPANLNDGERDGIYANGLGVDGSGSLAHSGSPGPNQEMGVTIPSAVSISYVDLFNRPGFETRLDGGGSFPFTLNIFNGNTLVYTHDYTYATTISLTGLNPNNNQTESAVGMTMYLPPGGVVGDYVQIFQHNSDWMNLAELEAYKTPEPASLAIWGVVIAGGLLVARRRKA